MTRSISMKFYGLSVACVVLGTSGLAAHAQQDKKPATSSRMIRNWWSRATLCVFCAHRSTTPL